MSTKEEIRDHIISLVNKHYADHNVKQTLTADSWSKVVGDGECKSLDELTSQIAAKYGVKPPNTKQFTTLDQAVDYVFGNQKK